MSGEPLNKILEVTTMCNNFCGNNNWWWIIILILLFSCCGSNGSNWNGCGCGNDRCGNDCGCC